MDRIFKHSANLILIAANLVPLVGVLAWDWDAFVLLMLYWLETAIIAFWTIARIATLSADALDGIAIGSGKSIASSLGLAAFFTLHAGIFMAVHFLFLWALFSGEWASRIHGPRDFVDQMVIGTGLWLPLLVLFIARGGGMLLEVLRPRLYRWRDIVPREPPQPATADPGEPLVFGLYIRIVVMQVTIIIGAWFAMLFGSAGALALLIVVKTAVDLSFQSLSSHVQASWRRAKADETGESQAQG